MRLTPPDLFRVTDFELDVARLVDERLGTPMAPRRRKNAEDSLRRLLKQHGLDAWVGGAERLELRGAGGAKHALPFTVPFHYQNGRMNYVKPASVADVLNEAFTQQVSMWSWAARQIRAELEGNLVIVIDADDSAAIEHAAEYVEPAGGTLRWLQQPDQLIADIRSAYEAHRDD